MTDRDPLMDALARLDPARTDAPPGSGSDRHRRILEHAMSTADTRPADDAVHDVDDHGPSPVIGLDDRARRPRRRALVLLGAAAALLVVVALAMGLTRSGDDDLDVVDGPTTTSPAPFDPDSVKVRATYERPVGSDSLVAEVDGTDSHKVTTGFDGSTEETTVIGDQVWDLGESAEPFTVTPDMVNRPYPEASAAVLAALEQAELVEDLGVEEVAGVEARHLSIVLGRSGVDALSALPGNQTGQFELEDAFSVTALDVWVTGDLIRRVEVELTPGTTDEPGGEPESTRVTIEYYDVGVRNVVEPPG